MAKNKELTVTVGIPTKNRYDALNSTLLSIAMQEYSPLEVIIVDDNDTPLNLTEHPLYNYVLRLFNDKGIEWRVIYGPKKGQHHSHQIIQETAKGDLVFRIDDDEVAEPDVIRRLVGIMKTKDKVGAVGPAVLMPNAATLPAGVKNTMKSLSKSPNAQWFKGVGVSEAEHLYSCFLYRKGVARYDLALSTVAHREETIFSHSIHKMGYNLYVAHDAKVWHFRQEEGGIRTFKHSPQLWDHDEAIFNGYMNLWGYDVDVKYVVLDNGLGDHYCFKNILPELRKKHKEIVIACCFPDIFFDEEGVELMSIAEAKLKFGSIDNFNIYKWMIDRNWNKSLLEAFRALYL